MQNLKPFLKSITKTDPATTVVASAMFTVCALAMILTWGILALAAVFAVAPKAVVRMAAVGEYDPCVTRTDCALRIDSAARFDQLVVAPSELDRDSYRGRFVEVLAPRLPQATQYCAGRDRCLTVPVFYNRAVFSPHDFIASYYPDTFAGLTNLQPYCLFYDCSRSGGTTAPQQIYETVKVFDIAQAPGTYGVTQQFEENQLFTVTPPSYEAVASLMATLQTSFPHATLHYYPDGRHRILQEQARAWADPPFPIFYELFWAESVATEAEYRKLLACEPTAEFCRLLYIVPRHPQVDSYCADFAARGEACLDHTLFANGRPMSGWHGDVFRLLYPAQVAQVESSDKSKLFGPDGIYRVGSIWREPLAPDYFFNIDDLNVQMGQFVPLNLSLAGVQEVHRALKQGFTLAAADQWAYVPTPGSEQEQIALGWVDQNPGFRIVFRDDAVYEAYTTGTAYGRIRVLTPERFAELQRTAGISWQDFLVFAVAPFDVETPVAGTITATPQLPSASHLALRAARRGMPNAYHLYAVDKFSPYEGQLVKVVVSEREYTVTPAGASEAEAWWAERRPRLKPPQPINRTYRGLDRIREMADEPTSRFSRFGGKASNLSKLYAFLPERYQLEAFAIPFAYYYDFIRGSRINDSSTFPPACRFGSVTYEEFLNRVLASAEFRSNPAVRGQCLDAFYSYGRQHGRVDPALVRQLIARIQELWGDANNDGRDDVTGKNIQVRFRSSSNMEDGVEFNGAGLYESTTVCLRDQLDDDTLATCDPNEDHEETIERALRKVWMSTWLPRAFEEREYWQLPQDQGAMAILVNTGTPDERDNGVAFTGDPTYPRNKPSNFWWAYRIYARPGEGSVVSSEAGVKVELDELLFEAQLNPPLAVFVTRIQKSSEVPIVLSNGKLEEMGLVMRSIERSFPLDRGGYPPERVILDMEFKHLPSDQLIIKQVRPFLIGQAVNFTGTPVLPQAPSDLSAEAAPTQVTLRWQAAAADDALAVVERSFTGTVWQAVATMRSSVRSYTDTTVRPGSTYHYRVRFENAFGQSEPSPAVIVTVPQPPQCADGMDNDGDGKVDLQDPGCRNAEDDDETDPQFRRGDADGRGSVDLTDAIFLLQHLFQQGPNPSCQDAADANDDGSLDLSDSISILFYLFTADQPAPPNPGPTTPGPDPTADGLDCAQYPAP